MANLNFEHELGTLANRDVTGLMDILIKQQPTLFKVIGTGAEVNTHKFEWIEKQLTPSQWAITGFGTDGDGVVLKFASTVGLSAGMILRFLKATGANVTEMVKIVSIDSATDITVSRDYDGTAGVTLVIGDVAKAFDSRQEGFTAGTGSILAPTLNYNYTVIDSEEFFLTRNAIESAKVGSYDALQDGMNEALTKILWKQSDRLIYGRRVVRSSTDKGQTGGLIQMLTGGNVNTSGGALTAAHINTTIESLVDDGASANKLLLVMNTNQAKKLTALNSVTYVTSNSVVNSQIGGSVKQFIPDFQLPNMTAGADVYVEPTMPKDMILVVNPSLVKVRYWLKPEFKDISVVNVDAKAFQIKTEYGFEIKNGTTAHGMITGLNV